MKEREEGGGGGRKQADKVSVKDDTQCISVSVCLLWLGRGGNKLIAISGKLDDI